MTADLLTTLVLCLTIAFLVVVACVVAFVLLAIRPAWRQFEADRREMDERRARLRQGTGGTLRRSA